MSLGAGRDGEERGGAGRGGRLVGLLITSASSRAEPPWGLRAAGRRGVAGLSGAWRAERLADV